MSGLPISLRIFQFVVIHVVKGFSVINEYEVDVFLKFSGFFYDLMDVGIKMIANNKFWGGCGEKGTHVHYSVGGNWCSHYAKQY